jgi:hypothetical protein
MLGKHRFAGVIDAAFIDELTHHGCVARYFLVADDDATPG